MDLDAVEIDRVVPANGNLRVCGQQFWLGPDRAGRTLTLWIDTTTVHLSLEGRGGIQIVGQRVQVSLRYTGQIVTIEVDETTLRVYIQHDHLIKTIPRTDQMLTLVGPKHSR